jgi:5'-nucleotidase
MDKKLAAEVPGITCIIGGHTHHLLERPERIGNTAICAAGKFGQFVGEIVITFDANHTCTVEAQVIRTADTEPDAEIEALIDSFKTIAERALTIPIATVAQEIPHHYDEDSVLGNLLAQTVRKKTNTPFAIINNGQFLAGFAAGEISKQMLLERCPSPVQICKMRLKGALIRHTLEESLLEAYKQYKFHGFGFRGDVLGGLSVDGLSIHYESDGPEMAKIKTILVNGEPMQDDLDYVFGTLDLFTFGVGYKKLQEGQDMEFFLPSIIRDELIEILNESTAIAHAFHKRWHKL